MLTSVYGELERLKEENKILEKRCNDVCRQLELANHYSTSEIEVSRKLLVRFILVR